MIGIIYHVIEKDTNRVIKVGSTIRSLSTRWSMYDKKRYSNHFLKEIKRIESSDFDVYDSEDAFCPFLWHLVAAEHMEMVRINTYRVSALSNQFSPLWQKYSGFDAAEGSKAAGSLGLKIVIENKLGILSPDFDRVSAARKGGLANVKSGHLQRISSKGGKVAGAIVGKRNAESGFMARISKLSTGVGWRDGSGLHRRWHVNRGLKSETCRFCQQAG